MTRPPPYSTLFPYTTLFRSPPFGAVVVEQAQLDALGDFREEGEVGARAVEGGAQGVGPSAPDLHVPRVDGPSLGGAWDDEGPLDAEGALRGGRYWDRTSDLFRVREARYRCANRPRRPRTRGRDGADDRIRTGDPHLGKVMLYQLSYVRTSAEPTKDDDIPARPASQMLGARSVRGHRGGEGAGHRAGAEWEAREAG